MLQVFAQEYVEACVDHLEVAIADKDKGIEAIENSADFVYKKPAIVTTFARSD